MTDQIKPALSATEWAREDAVLAISAEKMRVLRSGPHAKLLLAQPGHEVYVEGQGRLAKLIAFANAALPDSDPCKITWEWVKALRRAAQDIEDADAMITEVAPEYAPVLRSIAAALASYLPPEK